MPGENLRRLRRARPLPVKVEAFRIPLGAEFVNRLRPYHLASREPVVLASLQAGLSDRKAAMFAQA